MSTRREVVARPTLRVHVWQGECLTCRTVSALVVVTAALVHFQAGSVRLSLPFQDVVLRSNWQRFSHATREASQSACLICLPKGSCLMSSGTRNQAAGSKNAKQPGDVWLSFYCSEQIHQLLHNLKPLPAESNRHKVNDPCPSLVMSTVVHAFYNNNQQMKSLINKEVACKGINRKVQCMKEQASRSSCSW